MFFLVLVINSLLLYKTFAFFEEKKEFNILQGQIPNFESDVEFAIHLDSNEVDSIPQKGNYLVEVICNKGKGEWDYNQWNVIVKDLENATKCNLNFTSVNEEDMPPSIYNKSIERVTKNATVSLEVRNSSNMWASRDIQFDFSDVTGYENFTVDNFATYFGQTIASTTSNRAFDFFLIRADIKDYNNKTGIVTIDYYYQIYYGELHPSYTNTTLFCSLFY